MKKHKEMFAGIIISAVGFILAIVVALLVVESKVPSSASNNGWLGFLGGLFGSFVSGMITFWVLYINRKDMEDGEVKRYKMSEMDKMEGYLKEAFNLIRIDPSDRLAVTDFLLILNMIEPSYQETEYYKLMQKNLNDCNCQMTATVLANEEETYGQFIEYRKHYIEGK